MKATDTCRACHAGIVWVLSASSGRRMPIDPQPDELGNVWIEYYEGNTPVVQVVSASTGVPAGEVAYRSHFASCPNAKQFQRKGKAKGKKK